MFRGKKVVVLGFNGSDDRDIALKFLAENGATYRSILDSSPEAWQAMAQYETLGMSAVPMTYLIDPEGKVVEAWYGFNDGRMDKCIELIDEWLAKDEDR